MLGYGLFKDFCRFSCFFCPQKVKKATQRIKRNFSYNYEVTHRENQIYIRSLYAFIINVVFVFELSRWNYEEFSRFV